MAVLIAYDDQEPESVKVNGVLSPSGVDESAFITLNYSDGRVANATCCARVQESILNFCTIIDKWHLIGIC